MLPKSVIIQSSNTKKEFDLKTLIDLHFFVLKFPISEHEVILSCYIHLQKDLKCYLLVNLKVLESQE